MHNIIADPSKQPWEALTDAYTLVPAICTERAGSLEDHQASLNGPQLVILCTWTDATPKNIWKYVEGYRALFPTSPVLVARTASRSFFHTDASLMHNVSASTGLILKVLRAKDDGDFGIGTDSILVHALSNGGCGHFYYLARRFHAELGFPLPIGALILDSTPTRPTFQTLLASLSLSIPSSFLLRQPLKIILGAAVFCAYIMPRWFGASNLGERIYHGLLSLETEDGDQTHGGNCNWLRRECLRCYIFSDADLLCPPADILAHLKQSRSMGLQVRQEMWNDSEHVSHMRHDPDRYWSVVRSTWDEARVKAG